MSPFESADKEEEHTILVAFSVKSGSRTEAMAEIYKVLPNVPEHEKLVCWWIAEDDRMDNSDEDSAVFVTPGNQESASFLLRIMKQTPKHNVVNRPDSRFEKDD